MAFNTANITSSNPGRNGVFFRAPVGTPVPTNATDELDPAFIDQGIVGEDGVALSVTRDTDDIKAYGGDVVYTLQTDYGEEITLTVYESMHVPTLRTVFGDDNVVESGGVITVKHNKARLPRSTMVFDHIIDQGVKRQVAEIAQVISVGDIVNVHTDIVRYELTIKLYPDANGNTLVEYFSLNTDPNVLGVATSTLVPGKVGEAYDVRISAAGGKPPYTFDAVGELPAGLSLESDGQLHGTPTEQGRKSFVVRVTDSESKKAQKTLELEIAAGN